MTTLEITRSIDINAPAEKVWAALTEPDLIAQWFGDTCEFDPRPGGAGSFGWTAHGTFRVVVEHADRPKTLIYRWAREQGVDPVPATRPSCGSTSPNPRAAPGSRFSKPDSTSSPTRSRRMTTTPAVGWPSSANSWSSWNPGD